MLLISLFIKQRSYDRDKRWKQWQTIWRSLKTLPGHVGTVSGKAKFKWSWDWEGISQPVSWASASTLIIRGWARKMWAWCEGCGWFNESRHRWVGGTQKGHRDLERFPLFGRKQMLHPASKRARRTIWRSTDWLASLQPLGNS